MNGKILILTAMMCIFLVGCSNTSGKQNNEDTTSQNDSTTTIETEQINDELYAIIKTLGEKKFDDKVEFKAEINGIANKEIKYKWSLERSAEQDENPIDGLVSESGPVNEIINDGETVAFAAFAEVSYEPGAYNENTLKLEILDKENDNVLAKDSVKIKNYEGRYIIDNAFNKKLNDMLLKSPKAKIYSEVIDRLWGMDSALNSGVNYIDIDTSTFQGLDEEDKKQLFNYLEKQYDVKVLSMTIDELEKTGYVKQLSFNNGVVFKIDEYTVNTSDKISFTGSKWASGNGAIGFSVEIEARNGVWEIIKCDTTWIS